MNVSQFNLKRLLSFFILFSSAYIVLTFQLPQLFENEPSAGPFSGIRLHYLDAWNFNFNQVHTSTDLLSNFWGSFVVGQHGMVDYLHYYLMVSFFDKFHIAITEVNLLRGQSLLLTLSLILFSLCWMKLYRSTLAAIIFFIFAFFQLAPYGKSFYIMASHLFYEAILYSALIFFFNVKSTACRSTWGILSALALFLNVLSGNIILLPLFFYFIWAIGVSNEEPCLKRLLQLWSLPVIIALIGHFYLYVRVGQSHLGIIGYAIQKLGSNVSVDSLDIGHAFMSYCGAYLSKLAVFLKSSVFSIQGMIIFFVFYCINLFRTTGGRSLKLFPLFYVLYLSPFEPHHASLPLVALFSMGFYEILLQIFSLGMKSKWIRMASYVTLGILCVVIMNVSKISERLQIQAILHGQKVEPNYLKAIGFFLREHMDKDEPVASLLEDTDNILAEYYYGKSFYKSALYGKQIYSFENISQLRGPVSSDEMRNGFSFYVVARNRLLDDKYKKFVSEQVQLYELSPVAEVTYEDKSPYVIYGRGALTFVSIDVLSAHKEFDMKYAHLKDLFSHPHVGMASTFGNY